ncbi:hypothetical protein [Rhodopirellula sp. MGV]|uniref:hypothetical protein n=1 Tax=Rhodopirellula sp. MGV TaxID=2023130 RepID=UPI000B970BA4|nr:hypothetical protein [Rhodopirellula sp. MGV]OYP33073.1 hypothetical protein CGZ80_18455 [Rhodopirellula sp. MGV]PNY37974.1 DNA-binding protein [Rhodopirellula baltica]
MSKTKKKTATGTKLLDAQLIAGGMVHVDAKVDEAATEHVVARKYVGPAIGDRVVVRLGADRLGPAEDLAMEFLGLASAGESKPLAKQSRRALGFASWALITHPENAKYALSLVKRMKAAGRKAKSKPGHAWDQYAEMADELNRSVKEFLPPFWEETGRTYKEYGNTSYAGRAIGKALEAERVHSLDVDKERRRDAVLEFTLSGCLSGKALTEYTKDLERQFEPEEAFETLRDLLVRRTMGGMPPLATAGKDLARFAKAAGRDPDAEVDAVLQHIIASPSMARAPKQFWKSVTKNVARLAASDESFAMWLLVHTNCEPSYYKDSAVWDWLDLLDEWNVLPLLGKPAEELPKDVMIPGGRAGWISRLIAVESCPKPRLFDLIDLAADAIREEGEPLRLGEGSYYRSNLDVDVIEHLLDLGLEIADPPDRRSLDFSGWLLETVDHIRRNSSLKNLAADDRFYRKLLDQIADLVKHRGNSKSPAYGRKLPPTRSFEAAAADKPAIHDVWWNFLDKNLQALECGGLPDAENSLNLLVDCARETTGKQFPEFVKRLRKVDLIKTLQRTLQAGVIDEYGWDALDAVDDEERLPRFANRSQSQTLLMFPYVTVLREGKANCVGKESRVLGEFKLGKNESPVAIIPVRDDAVLLYRDDHYRDSAVWLSDPNESFEPSISYYQLDANGLMEVDSGVFYGSRILQSGDQSIPASRHWYSDGQRYWALSETYSHWNEFDTLANQDDSQPVQKSLIEIDPANGQKGRASVPAWFEQFATAGSRIAWATSSLMPVPAGCESSPLGVKDGLIGWCITRQRDGTFKSQGIDGRTYTSPTDIGDLHYGMPCLAMVDKPAGKGHWLVLQNNSVVDSETGIGFAGPKDRYHFGQPITLPIQFWNYFRIRCVESSKQLRKLKLADAKAFFDAGKIEHEALKVKEDPKKPDPNREAASTAVRKVLGKAPDRLVKGISRVARLASTEQISLDKLISVVSGEAAKATTKAKGRVDTSAFTDEQWDDLGTELTSLAIPLEGLERNLDGHYGQRSISAKHLLEVAAFFKQGKTYLEHSPAESKQGKGVQLTKSSVNYVGMLDDPPSAAWQAFWKRIHTGADDGVAVPKRLAGNWLKAFEFFADSGLLQLQGTMALYLTEDLNRDTYNELKKKHGLPENDAPVAWVVGKQCYVVYSISSYLDSYFVILGYASSGTLKPPSGFNFATTIPIRKRWMATSLKTFAETVPKVEMLPLVEQDDLDAAAEKLGRSTIEVALAWMGNYRSVRYGQEKLTKELRSHYGWKVADIKTAVTALDADPPAASVLSEAARFDATGAMTTKVARNFRAMVNAWAESSKQSVTIPSDVATVLQKVLPSYRSLNQKHLADFLGEPENFWLLADRTVTFELKKQARYSKAIAETLDPPSKLDEDATYPVLCRVIWVLNYECPAASELRQLLPRAIECLRDYVARKGTSLPFGESRTVMGYPDEEVDIEGTVERFTAVVGKCKLGKDNLYRFDNGLIFGAMLPPAVELRFRTAKLKTDADYDALIAAAGQTFGYESDGSDSINQARFVASILSGEMDAIIANNRDSSVEAGQWDQDPRNSVPKLVKEVSKKRKVSEDAAVLYLQVLALHDPNNNNLKKWNGWTTKQIKAAAAELVTAELLVTAKRSRAGREFFLPGGWEALKAPNPPIETWKLPLFGYENTDALRGSYGDVIVCPRAVHRQFEVAWERVCSGDVPSYEEAKV